MFIRYLFAFFLFLVLCTPVLADETCSDVITNWSGTCKNAQIEGASYSYKQTQSFTNGASTSTINRIVFKFNGTVTNRIYKILWLQENSTSSPPLTGNNYADYMFQNGTSTMFIARPLNYANSASGTEYIFNPIGYNDDFELKPNTKYYMSFIAYFNLDGYRYLCRDDGELDNGEFITSRAGESIGDLQFKLQYCEEEDTCPEGSNCPFPLGSITARNHQFLYYIIPFLLLIAIIYAYAYRFSL